MNGGCIDDVRKTSNGAEVARRIPREQAKFLARSRNVAAIDFGTTNCSIAYLTEADSPEQEPHRLLLNGTYERVPTAILFKKMVRLCLSVTKLARTISIWTTTPVRKLTSSLNKIKMKLQQDEGENALVYFLFLVFSYVQSIINITNPALQQFTGRNSPLITTVLSYTCMSGGKYIRTKH